MDSLMDSWVLQFRVETLEEPNPIDNSQPLGETHWLLSSIFAHRYAQTRTLGLPCIETLVDCKDIREMSVSRKPLNPEYDSRVRVTRSATGHRAKVREFESKRISDFRPGLHISSAIHTGGHRLVVSRVVGLFCLGTSTGAIIRNFKNMKL